MNNHNNLYINEFIKFIDGITIKNIQLSPHKIDSHFPFSKFYNKNITINNLMNCKNNNNTIFFEFIKLTNNQKTLYKANIDLRRNTTNFSLSFDTPYIHYNKMKTHALSYLFRTKLNINDTCPFYKKLSDNKYIINILPHEPSFVIIKNNNNIIIKLCNCIRIMKTDNLYNLLYDHDNSFDDNNKIYKMISCANIDANINLLDISIIKNIVNNYHPSIIISKIICNGNNNYTKIYIDKIYENKKIIQNYIFDTTYKNDINIKKSMSEEKDDIVFEFEFMYPFDNNSEYIKTLCNNGLGLTINFNNLNIYKIRY
jgi:hypothetical protein